jgi:hypothetical protein
MSERFKSGQAVVVTVTRFGTTRTFPAKFVRYQGSAKGEWAVVQKDDGETTIRPSCIKAA